MFRSLLDLSVSVFFFVSSALLFDVGGVGVLLPMLHSFEPRLLVSRWVANFVFLTQYSLANLTLVP